MCSTAICLILALCAATCESNVNSRTPEDNESENWIFEKYLKLDKNLKEMVNSGIKTILPHILQGTEHMNISSRCSNDIFRFISDVRKLKGSAFKMLDATSKLPAGLLTGNLYQFGDFDECMATAAIQKDGSVAYTGQYCMLYLKPILPRRPKGVNIQNGFREMKEAMRNASELMQLVTAIIHHGYMSDLKFGLCVPSGCRLEDIDTIAKYVGEKIMLTARVAYCETQQEKSVSTGKIIAIFFYSLIGLLAILGTVLDYYGRKKSVTFQSTCAKCTLCFSVLTNFPKIINIQVTDRPLSFLFGIRSLCLFYIILLHQYFFIEKLGVEGHLRQYEKDIPSFIFQIITNGFLTTEVFIFLGGFVHSYTTLKYMENCKRKTSYAAKILHRLLRIYPPYLFIMMLIYLVRDVKGPISPLADQVYWSNCDHNWWLNVIFINNFFNQEKACLFHGWYIAADMHLFLISMFTVPLFAKHPKKGIIVHAGILVTGLLSTVLWAWYKNTLPGIIASSLDRVELNNVWNAYTATFPHIAPYFTGLLMGYFISAYKDFKIPLVYRLIGWPVAVLAFSSMLFMTQRWNSGVEATLLESALYFSFSRWIYVLAVGWLVLCCVRGYGGVLNYFLSLRVWVVISRLSYMMFLVSPICQTFYVSHFKMVIDNDNINLIWRYFGDLGVSFCMALIMSTLIESPVVALEKIIFGIKSTEGTKDVESEPGAETDKKFHSEIEMENNIKNAVIDAQSKQIRY